MTSPEGESPSPQGRFVVTPVRSLATLVAAHPRALQSLFHAGTLAEPSLVGDAPAARLLSIADGTNLFYGLRGAIRLVSSLLAPMAWTGKVFDHGGNSGRDAFFGKRLFRFHTEVGPSLFDGQPVLILSYREPGLPKPLAVSFDSQRAAHGGPRHCDWALAHRARGALRRCYSGSVWRRRGRARGPRGRG